MNDFDDFYIMDGVLISYKGNGGDIIIPSEVKEIGDNAFSGSDIMSLRAYNNLSRIGEKAFLNCLSLSAVCIGSEQEQATASLSEDDGEGVETEICESAFSGCSALKKVKLSDCVKRIGNRGFYGCYSLENITMPNGIKSIGERAFLGCGFLTSISIPNGITSIDEFVFQGCQRLTDILIPSGVTVIDNGAFGYCRGLESIIIPDRESISDLHPTISY